MLLFEEELLMVRTNNLSVVCFILIILYCNIKTTERSNVHPKTFAIQPNRIYRFVISFICKIKFSNDISII